MTEGAGVGGPGRGRGGASSRRARARAHLSEPHFVGEQAGAAGRPLVQEPLDALQLVVAQFHVAHRHGLSGRASWGRGGAWVHG